MARQHDLPADPQTVGSLAARGLRYALVDAHDAGAYRPWYRALTRGFYGSEPDDGYLDQSRDAYGYRRHTGVYDDAIAHPEVPVATVNSWPSPLALPGGREVEAWAISSVSVAPTHRRRGIARDLIEGELRTAAAYGTPLAMLTVSESGIYGRFGFAPAAHASTWVIDTRRVSWTGPVPDGRVEFITLDEYLAEASALHAATRAILPGEVEMWEGRWRQRAGVFSDDPSTAKATRAIRYVDAAGTTRGTAVYRVRGGDDDFTAHHVDVVHLWAPHADAHAGLWRFLLELDLVTRVTARLVRVDDPLRWSIGDWRAAQVTLEDHQYVRILDVPATFAARGYDGAGEIAFEVDDPYGFAAGAWVLRVADGVGRAERAEAGGIPALALGVAELSALSLGGVRATDLLTAGRVRELSPGAARTADAVLHSLVTPSLSGWY